MLDNYSNIVQDNLRRLYGNLPIDLSTNLPAKKVGEQFHFVAFGEKCVIDPDRIILGEEEHFAVFDLIISVYALTANSEKCVLFPLKAFKEFPDSMSHVAASAMPTSKLLSPHVAKIKNEMYHIIRKFNGGKGPNDAGGDFSFIVYPLPKIALCYIFYEADDDFPASVSCLYSNNANQFMPVGGLADVGEYTSKQILRIIDR